MNDLTFSVLVTAPVLAVLILFAPDGATEVPVRQVRPTVTALAPDNTADAPPPPTIPVLARPILAGPTETPSPEPAHTHPEAPHTHGPEPAPPPDPPDSHIPEPWASLAQCESGGRWHLPHGPYSGGLQFRHGTWVGFGGQQYSQHAHGATVWQQISVAQRVQQAQGWGAWPRCSREVGLR